jgi:hypothetical protein
MLKECGWTEQIEKAVQNAWNTETRKEKKNILWVVLGVMTLHLLKGMEKIGRL